MNSNDGLFKNKPLPPFSFAMRHVANTKMYEFKSGVPLVEHFMADMKKQQCGSFLLGIWGICFFILILNHCSNIKGILFRY